MPEDDQNAAIVLQRKPTRGETGIAAATAVLLAAVFVMVAPWASVPCPVIPGFMPAFTGAMVIIDLVLAVLLFSKGTIHGRAESIRLGTAYLYGALIIIPHVAAFPGAITPTGLIGTSASAVWLWSFWHAGFAIAIMRRVLAQGTELRPGMTRNAIVGTVATVGLLTLVATLGQPYLPSILSGRSYQANLLALGLQCVVIATNLIAFAMVVGRLRLRSGEDLWLGLAMLAACVDVMLTFLAGSRFTLGWYMSRAASLVTAMVVLLSVFRDIGALHGDVARANRLLARLAHIDGLTGLANRRQFDATLMTEWRRARRDERPLSLVMLDVDHFKSYNDTYGHQEGDACLRSIGACLGGLVQRPGDLVARYGGEEFVLVLPATDLTGAIHVADELRAAVRALAIPHSASPHGVVTVSLGVTAAVPRTDDDVQLLLAQADAALYRAKTAGRDQVHSGLAEVFGRARFDDGAEASAKRSA